LPDITRDESLDDLLAGIDGASGEAAPEKGDRPLPVGSRIKAFREQHGLSLQQMAEKTGFSSALLSQIENRMISPPLGALVRIANAFVTPVSALLGDREERAFAIVRREERLRTASRVGLKDGGRPGYTYEALGAGKAGRRMEPFIVRLQPAPKGGFRRNAHEGEEFLYVLSGRVEVVLGRHSDVLSEGDSIYYDSTIPHHVHSADDAETMILAVIHQGP
jgi:transcriptional regulator with XRE-family HTH domain